MEQRRTVLLADTSTEFRILLREAMEKTGEFLVEIAQTGDEVLEKVQEQEPDILIMDVILPGLDGLSALRELQELGYAPMTILTSAFVSDQTLTEATELGAAYFLPKPFRMETLLDRMRNLFREKPKATRPSLKARVTHMLHDAGMPANISGYQYLREAILITAADPSVLNKAVTKILYPEIARVTAPPPSVWNGVSAAPSRSPGTGLRRRHSPNTSAAPSAVSVENPPMRNSLPCWQNG